MWPAIIMVLAFFVFDFFMPTTVPMSAIKVSLQQGVSSAFIIAIIFCSRAGIPLSRRPVFPASTPAAGRFARPRFSSPLSSLPELDPFTPPWSYSSSRRSRGRGSRRHKDNRVSGQSTGACRGSKARFLSLLASAAEADCPRLLVRLRVMGCFVSGRRFHSCR